MKALWYLWAALIIGMPWLRGAQQDRRRLLKAAKRGDIQAVISRVKNSVKNSKYVQQEINAHHAKTGLTPLHWAAHRGDIAMARILVRNGANINAQDNDGQTPLHAAAFDGCWPLVIYLVDHGARNFVRDKQYKLPVDYAAQQGYREVAQALLSYDRLRAQIPVYAQNSHMLGLILAQSIECGFCSVVKLLLDAGLVPTQHSITLAYNRYQETHDTSYKRIYNSLKRARRLGKSKHKK